MVKADQCMFGLKAAAVGGHGAEAPPKKSTGFVSNSWAVIESFNKRCSGDHVHAWLGRGRAAKAAIDPRVLCEASCKGLKTQKDHDMIMKTQCFVMASENKTSIVSSDPGDVETDFIYKLMQEFDCVRVATHGVLGPIGARGGFAAPR